MNSFSRRRTVIVLACLVILSVVGTGWMVLLNGADFLRSAILDALVYYDSYEQENRLQILSVYAITCLVTQLIIVPSGSLILIVAGFFIGPLLAVGIFSVAQVVALWPVYKFTEHFIDSENSVFLKRCQQKIAANSYAQLLAREGIAAGVVLRLTPVIPSAAASVLAALLSIPLKAFTIATLLVCWVRPLFFASVGGALKEVSNLAATLDGTVAVSVWPLVLVFLASVGLLASRFWLRRQGG